MADAISLKTAPYELQRKLDPKAQDAKLHEVANLYEEQFLREMVKAMRGTVQESGLIKVSQGEQLYREQLDQNYVEQWTKKGGLGLQDIIYQQLLERYGPMLGIKPGMAKPQGPLPLTEKSNFNPQFTPGQQHLSTRFARIAQGAQGDSLRAPWSGNILGVQEFNPSEYALSMGHDEALGEGARSQLVFRGLLAPEIKPGAEVSAGATLGQLSPEVQSFFWNLQATDGLKARNPSIAK